MMFRVRRSGQVLVCFSRAPRLARLSIAALVFAAALPCSAMADQNTTLLQEQLAAGEFAPAIATATKVPERAKRDAILAEIATAQVRAGGRSAAFATVSLLDGDRPRAAAIEAVQREPMGGRGGGVQPDFDSLIELLTATVAPTTWSEVGGNGAVKEFAGGVAVDPAGNITRIPVEAQDKLARLRADALLPRAASPVEERSKLRKVSLTRLERDVQLRLAAGLPLDDAIQVFAGLERIEYLLVYPESGELVVAGPAGGWVVDREGRVVSAETGRPLVRLEDFVALWRHVQQAPDGKFSCSIKPRREALEKTQAFVAESNKRALKPGERPAWLEKLRAQVGAQDVTIHGIDPRTRAARVIVEADYRMKLVGIGLEPGTLQVPSYLSQIEVPPGGTPPPLDVLRWWFTMNYEAIDTDPQRQAFGLRGTGVKVLCENEFLDPRGERVHTGQASDANQQFARNFTKHFTSLAAKYPIYAELQNVFDLALVATLIRREGLADRVGWHATCFGVGGGYPLTLEAAPRSVQTVLNHRVVNKVNILAAVSGGVTVYPVEQLENTLRIDEPRLSYARQQPSPSQIDRQRWWWD